MSVDFVALFDSTREELTPAWLLARVVGLPDVFAYFVEHYGHLFRPKAWALEVVPSRGEGRPWVAGPGGFIIDVRSDTVELWHGIRFSHFTGDPDHREALRKVCRVVADLVGSDRAVYTHECMPYPAIGGLANVETTLQSKIGPAAETFDELNAAEEYGPRAWYIDTFAVRRTT